MISHIVAASPIPRERQDDLGLELRREGSAGFGIRRRNAPRIVHFASRRLPALQDARGLEAHRVLDFGMLLT
jgi:hypothetical protein